jgi:hypothetical protein
MSQELASSSEGPVTSLAFAYHGKFEDVGKLGPYDSEQEKGPSQDGVYEVSSTKDKGMVTLILIFRSNP